MMNFSDGLSVNWIRIACQLVDLLVHLLFNLTHELLVVPSVTCLFRDIEISNCIALSFQLPEHNLLVWCGDHHVLLLHLLFT